MRKLLIGLWAVGLAFFVWEFVVADGLPARYAQLQPTTIRLVDLAFGVVIVLTLAYLLSDRRVR